MLFDEIKRRMSAFRVGIAGAGGLGSNCAQALVRSGIGALVIADFDIVEERNLNRQFFFSDQCGMKKVEALKINLDRIGTGSHIIIHDLRLTPGNIPVIFAGCDVVVEAFDRSDMKMMLIETLACTMKQTPVIAASGLAGWGGNNAIRSRKIDDSLYVIGDESEEVSDHKPPLAPRVGIVASMEANLVLEILLNRKECE